MDVVLGIDIGGTFTKLGLVNRDGELLYEQSIETTKYDDPVSFVRAIHEVIYDYNSTQKESYKILGAGIGAPNGNYYTGNIEHAANLIWKGVIPLSDIMREKFNIP